jgi:DNA recombination protein RmuC
MSDGVYLLIGFAAGGGLFFFIGWMLGSRRQSPPDRRLEEELRQQMTQRETELAGLRDQLAHMGAARAAADANRSATEKLVTEQRALHEKAIREAKEIQAKAMFDLRDSFKALSADALKQTHPEFLRLASETFGKLRKRSRAWSSRSNSNWRPIKKVCNRVKRPSRPRWAK